MASKAAMKRYIKIAKGDSYEIRTIPFHELNKDENLELVKVSWKCLKYIPNQRKTKAICKAAVDRYPAALEYVPESKKSEELCNSAFKNSPSAFPYLPEHMRTIDRAISCYNRLLEDLNNSSLSSISMALTDEQHKDKRIFDLERKLGIRTIVKKEYKNNIFYVSENASFEEDTIESEFSDFASFYDYIEHDLSDANLLSYDFADIDLKSIDISNAYISSTVLMAQGLYSDDFYEENIKCDDLNTEMVPLSETEIETHAITIDNAHLSDDIRRVYYISDLHLNHMILNAFPKHASENEITFFIKELVNKLVNTKSEYDYNSFLLIAGDVSYNYKIAEIFYRELSLRWPVGKIIVVLGNHDLWNYGSKDSNSYNFKSIISMYKKLFEELNIVFLQNELFALEEKSRYWLEPIRISEKELQKNSVEWIKEKCKHCAFIVFGGIGFSGHNSTFNASHGIYRNTITTLKDDQKFTTQFESLYLKIKSALGHYKLVVLTHMPYKDWLSDELVASWVHVNGHTHRNTFCINDTKIIYADNQIGYHKKNAALKHFELSTHYDIFSDYSDGIYEISRDEYIDFNRGVKVNMEFNRTEGKITMLKKSGIYCFFYTSEKNVLYLLKGGVLRKLIHQDLEYFYNCMDIYKLALQDLMKNYYDALKHISEQIKLIGGDGKVHGNIVDIDFWNHILLNPFNGKVTAYHAESISYRKEYPTVEALLENERNDLFLTYKENNTAIEIFQTKKLNISKDVKTVVGDTSMYGPSNMFRSLQYMFDVNVIREWNEPVVEKLIKKYQDKYAVLDCIIR